MAESLQQRVLAKVQKLDNCLNNVEAMRQLEEKTGVPKAYVAIGAGTLLTLFVLFGVGAGFLTNAVGFIYPVYASFKAIESPAKDDDTQWLTYWVVFSFFTIIETFTDFILYWFPFYYSIKLGFLVWCFLPSTRGALFVYDHFIRPFLANYEADIDSFASSAGQASAQFAREAIRSGVPHMVNAASTIASAANDVAADTNTSTNSKKDA